MLSFLTAMIALIALCLVIVILIQNPKGGGIDSTYGMGAQQMFGAARSTETVEKVTWILASLLIALCVASYFFISQGGGTDIRLQSQ